MRFECSLCGREYFGRRNLQPVECSGCGSRQFRRPRRVITEPTTRDETTCLHCGSKMVFVHGHYQCDVGGCPRKGHNQTPCCD